MPRFSLGYQIAYLVNKDMRESVYPCTNVESEMYTLRRCSFLVHTSQILIVVSVVRPECS